MSDRAPPQCGAFFCADANKKFVRHSDAEKENFAQKYIDRLLLFF